VTVSGIVETRNQARTFRIEDPGADLDHRRCRALTSRSFEGLDRPRDHEIGVELGAQRVEERIVDRSSSGVGAPDGQFPHHPRLDHVVPTPDEQGQKQRGHDVSRVGVLDGPIEGDDGQRCPSSRPIDLGFTGPISELIEHVSDDALHQRLDGRGSTGAERPREVQAAGRGTAGSSHHELSDLHDTGRDRDLWGLGAIEDVDRAGEDGRRTGGLADGARAIHADQPDVPDPIPTKDGSDIRCGDVADPPLGEAGIQLRHHLRNRQRIPGVVRERNHGQTRPRLGGHRCDGCNE
jgi:hypothetical protein